MLVAHLDVQYILLKRANYALQFLKERILIDILNASGSTWSDPWHMELHEQQARFSRKELFRRFASNQVDDRAAGARFVADSETGDRPNRLVLRLPLGHQRLLAFGKNFHGVSFDRCFDSDPHVAALAEIKEIGVHRNVESYTWHCHSTHCMICSRSCHSV
jgi:hypothetical protein